MAVFKFTETTEIAIVGCIGDGRSRDWLGMVLRDAPDQPWYFRYRFRYYDAAGDPADPDAPDTKNVFEFRPTDAAAAVRVTRVELVVALRAAIAQLKAAGFGTDVEILDVDGGPELFREKIIARRSKFFHMWSAPPGPRGPSKFLV
jgi:hypothetical protein